MPDALGGMTFGATLAQRAADAIEDASVRRRCILVRFLDSRPRRENR